MQEDQSTPSSSAPTDQLQTESVSVPEPTPVGEEPNIAIPGADAVGGENDTAGEKVLNPTPVSPPSEPAVSAASSQEQNTIMKEVMRAPTQEEIQAAVRTELHRKLAVANTAKAAKREQRLETILAYLRTHPRATNRVLKSLFRGVSESSITNYLNELERRGKVRQVGARERAGYELIQ